jgi:hypothetical protein
MGVLYNFLMECVEMSQLANEPSVVDLSLFTNPQRSIQAMRNCGVITKDEDQAALLVVKRINHGAFADYSAGGMNEELKKAITNVQTEFRQKLQTMPYQQLVDGGHVNKLLDDYLGLLVQASEKKLYHLDNEALTGREENDPKRFNELRAAEESKRKKYSDEKSYYAGNPEIVKDAARRFENLVKHQGYLPVGKILAMSGTCGVEGEAAADLVQDVLGVVAARSVKGMLAKFVDDAALQRYEADPKANEVRIKALAETIAGMTSPLHSLRDFDKESPELDRINALKTLLSAQMHYAIMQERSPAQCIAVEREARHHVKECTDVVMSLAYDYMGMGPAMHDKRVQAIRANLKAEMERDGIRLIPGEEAKLRAAILARKSAEDLLQATHGDQQMTARINALAAAADVQLASMPLKKMPHIIGEDLLDVLKEKLAQRNVVVPDADTLAGFLKTELKRRAEAPSTPTLAA